MTLHELAIVKIQEAEQHLNREMIKKSAARDEETNSILIELTKLRIRLETQV